MDKPLLKDSLQEVFRRYSGSVAMQVKKGKDWESITYAELKNEIDGFTSFIKAQGFKRGDRAALLFENSPAWGIIFFACITSGVIVVPLATHSTPNEIKNIIDNSETKAIFLSKELEQLTERLKTSPSVEKVVIVDGKEVAEVKDIRKPPPRTMAGVENVAVILYTSGTTSSPKGVMLTHKNLYSNFDSISRYNIITSKDTVLAVLPLHHAYPLMITLIVPVLSGARIVYPGGDWPDTLANYIKDASVTVLVGVPQIFHALHRRIKSKMERLGFLSRLFIDLCINFSWAIYKACGYNLAKLFLSKMHGIFGRQLHFLLSGGAKLEEDVEKDLFRWGFTLLQGYGLTETSPVTSFNPPNKPKIGSVGKAMPDVTIKIVDKDKDGVGEVAIQGPNVMKGYYRKKDETRSCLKNGWFFSGDLGYLDDEGYLYLTGRSKELIVLSSGKNIYPEEVEAEYSKATFIKEICILGITKEAKADTQDYLYAVVFPDFDLLKERGEMNIYEVIKNRLEDISEKLANHKHIMGFMIIDEPLPRTVLGKVKRYEVEEKYRVDMLKRSHSQQKEPISLEEDNILSSEAGKRVVSYLKNTFNIKEAIKPNSSIEIDLGIDSLGRAELLSAMERNFGIKLPESIVAASIFTVRDLITTIEKSSGIKTGVSLAPSTIEQLPISEIVKRPLSAEFIEKIELNPGLFDKFLTFSVKAFNHLFFKIFYRLEVKGTENIPREGPCIICLNHTSFYDGFVACASIPFHCFIRLFFIGFRKYFVVPIVRSLVKRGRILAIDASQIVETMQAAYFILQHKKALCIFPEGERSSDGTTGRFKKGVGIIAKETEVILIPAVIEGAFEAWPRTRRFPKLGKIKVKFGSSVNPQQLLKEGHRLGIKDDAEAIASAIRERVISLK